MLSLGCEKTWVVEVSSQWRQIYAESLAHNIMAADDLAVVQGARASSGLALTQFDYDIYFMVSLTVGHNLLKSGCWNSQIRKRIICWITIVNSMPPDDLSKKWAWASAARCWPSLHMIFNFMLSLSCEMAQVIEIQSLWGQRYPRAP